MLALSHGYICLSHVGGPPQNVPLIFWGEPSAEYTAYYSYDQPEEVDEKHFNRL